MCTPIMKKIDIIVYYYNHFKKFFIKFKFLNLKNAVFFNFTENKKNKNHKYYSNLLIKMLDFNI